MQNALEAKLTYRENTVRSATPIELVVILFDTVIEDMRQAVSATQAGDLEARAVAIRHAMLVLQQLQGTLDFEKGGQVARQFEQFYNLVRAKLLEAQMRHSPELMQQQIQFMLEVRDCWAEAEKRLKPRMPEPAVMAAPLAGPDSLKEGGPTSQWSA